MTNGETKIWIVGGFARGHFEASLLKLADYTVSISPDSLPAHVVTARLTYDLEVELE
jgi:rRNA pseudouridine-1189 N-methylase Emg1 (Nep1/Mra1 family)